MLAAKTVPTFSSERRNIVRGVIAGSRNNDLDSGAIELLRDNRVEADMIAAATILESPDGLRQRKVTALVQGELQPVHHLSSRSALLETAYASAFLNSWKGQTKIAIQTIAVLSRLADVEPSDAITALLATVQTWGASSYITRKIMYAKEFLDLTDEDSAVLDMIDDILGHKQHPNAQFYALEVIHNSISLFTVARRHINIQQRATKGDFRKALSLSGLVATPFSEDDCAGFFLRAVETSLIDTVHSFWVVLTLRSRFPRIVECLERCLDPEVFSALRAAVDTASKSQAPSLIQEEVISPDEETTVSEHDNSLILYRRSAAFLEYPSLCEYRNDLDRVIGMRLVAPLLPPITSWNSEVFRDKEIIRRPNETFELKYHNQEAVKVDTFYRTYLFLRFIQDPFGLADLNESDIQDIFDRTMGLESLILESELRTLHINSAEEVRALISVLAMSLYRAKSSDPDIDFDFRQKLEEYITGSFNGKVGDFVEYLAPSSPQIANYLVASLDEATLQKMYTVVNSLAQAESIRRDILSIVGKHLGRIDYIVEAEAIGTRAKVAKLKDYFDTSRMFVDSVSMRKWLLSNPSAYMRQYKEMLPKLAARYAASKNVMTQSGKETRLDFFEITTTDEYLVLEMAKEAFREFCTNNEFGIESYLGRRIRHNTLQGVMTKSTDAVILRPDYQPIMAGTSFGRSMSSWEAGYKIYVERMRKEFLQFKTESKPNALFNSEMDINDPTTKRNIQLLSQTLRVSSFEMLDELIVSFCWRQIAPQLEAASRQIRVKMAQDMNQALDQLLGRFEGPEEIRIRTSLSEAVSSVFAQVASWFQIPQTGFVPASISELCNIIDLDYGRPPATTIVVGDDLDKQYYGISVHRLYDCLAVLLQNAYKHGNPKHPVNVEASATSIEGANLDILNISVRSQLVKGKAAECLSRVKAAVISTETSKDMVTEGYSGIKKVKFITRLNEGESTVQFSNEADDITVSFRLKAEIADRKAEDEDTSR